MTAERVVCVLPARNEEATVANVTRTLDAGLRMTGGHQAHILLGDNASTDRTREAFQSVPTVADKSVLHVPVPGKGKVMLAAIERALELDAAYVLFFDADLESMQPTWVVALLHACRIQLADLALPRYRTSQGGPLTNLVVRPSVNLVTGCDLAQPIGGECGLTRAFAETVTASDLPDETTGYGIDVYLTLLGLSNADRIASVDLGVKVHRGREWHTILPIVDEVFGALRAFTLRHGSLSKVAEVVEGDLCSPDNQGDVRRVSPSPVALSTIAVATADELRKANVRLDSERSPVWSTRPRLMRASPRGGSGRCTPADDGCCFQGRGCCFDAMPVPICVRGPGRGLRARPRRGAGFRRRLHSGVRRLAWRSARGSLMDELLGWNQHGRLREWQATGYWKPPCSAWIRVDREVDPRRLEEALGDLAHRHSALRSTFEVDEPPRVIYHDRTDWPLEVVDPDDPALDRLGRTFTPSEPQLKRAMLLRSPTTSVVGLAVDHSVCDGRSLDLLLNQLCAALDGRHLHEGSDVRDFYRDEKRWLNDGGEEALALWSAALAGSESAYPTPPGLFSGSPTECCGPTSDVRRLSVDVPDLPPGHVIFPNGPAAMAAFALALGRRITKTSAFLVPFHRRRTPRQVSTVGYLTTKIVVPVTKGPVDRATYVSWAIRALRTGMVPMEFVMESRRPNREPYPVPSPHVTLNLVEPTTNLPEGWERLGSADPTTARHNLGLHINVGSRRLSALWSTGMLALEEVESLLGETVGIGREER